MRRLLLPAGCLMIAVGLSGCAMCKAPCDYAGPVLGPEGCPEGGFLDRRGSVLQGGPGPGWEGAAGMPTPAMEQPSQGVPEPAPEMMPEPTLPTDSSAAARTTRASYRTAADRTRNARQRFLR